MKSATILFVVTSHAMMGDTGEKTGVWFEELSTPYYVFEDAGYDVKLASTAGGEIPIDPRSVADDELPESVQRFKADDAAMQALKTTPSVEGLKADDYAAVFLPGGHGTMWDLPKSEGLATLLSNAYQAGKPVSAVCHGPVGLIHATNAQGEPIVKGKTVAAFTNEEEAAVELTDAVPFLLEDKLKELGADFSEAAAFTPHAVADGNLITGQNPMSSEKTAKLVIEYLQNN